MTNEQTQLEKTVELQRQFWEELGNLEEILGVEIDGTADLSLTTIGQLLKGDPLPDDEDPDELNGITASDEVIDSQWPEVEERPSDDELTCAACADPKNGRYSADCTAEVPGAADCRAEVVTVACEEHKVGM